MKFIVNFIIFLLMLFPVVLYGQNDNEIDEIYLKSGNVITGSVIERTPDGDIKVRTIDGSVIIYSNDDVLRIEKRVISKKVRIRKEYDSRLFFILGLSIHPSHTSSYIMAGRVKRFGYYAQLKSNLRFGGGHDYEGDHNSSVFFNGSTTCGRNAITGGGLFRISSPIISYAGVGYGSRWVNWQLITGKQYRVTDISYDGLEVEAGFILRYKHSTYSFGLSTNSFEFMEANIGIGLNF